MSINFAINGFGRIGRAAAKIILQKTDAQLVAINDLSNPRVLAHLVKHDTAYGAYPHDVWIEEDGKRIDVEMYRGEKEFFTITGKETYLVIAGKKIRVINEKDPLNLPWSELAIDVVLECTGLFTKKDQAQLHLTAGAKTVVISAPSSDANVPTYMLGVNHEHLKKVPVFSNASCTTNCVSPVLAVLATNFNVVKAMMTTIHSVTSGQNIVDGPPNARKPDLRRARAAGWNMIPTATGAAHTVAKALPGFTGIFDGMAVRVPTITGSLVDLTVLLGTKTTVADVNQAFVAAANLPAYAKVLAVTYEPIVSSDIIGSPFSALVDLTLTKVVDGDLVKVVAWYDNEWGYSNRLVEAGMLNFVSN